MSFKIGLPRNQEAKDRDEQLGQSLKVADGNAETLRS